MNLFNNNNLHLYLTAVVVVLVVVAGSFFIVKGQSRFGKSLDVDLTSSLGKISSPDNFAVLVPIGRVGIKNSYPEAGLDVGDEVIFGKLSAFKITDHGIAHRETALSGTSVSYTNYGTCACLDKVVINSNNTTPNAYQSLLASVVDVFSIPSANALQQCYSAQEDCQTYGCSYCSDYGWSCNTGEYQCSGCVEGGTTADAAPCDAGDTEDSVVSGLCNGSAYVASRSCTKTTTSSVTDYFQKIGFSVSTTTIFDNLKANNNVRDDCDWEVADKCPAGKFQAGYDKLLDEIYCCNL